MAVRNAKSRKQDNPYQIWEAQGWEWRVLKFYSNDLDDPYARVFCAVRSPFTYGGFELGDVYLREIRSHATLTFQDEAMEVA